MGVGIQKAWPWRVTSVKDQGKSALIRSDDWVVRLAAEFTLCCGTCSIQCFGAELERVTRRVGVCVLTTIAVVVFLSCEWLRVCAIHLN